ncbi:phosphoribosylglycinamide formyltransferase [Halioxenophilus sp. WMMB6]|uniref:phosphoribosylglycinamide formyltransferase n=1 Tax=Halioxenophilus sp. WMMB6 TaxID=3073815 RepID=UPI00295E917C|nr:phosphoribosylglycinamide formyltransferase [Halioxenophilus sp. WMMB6]
MSPSQNSHVNRAPLRVVVLISGSGSNLQALIDGQQQGLLDIDIVAVLSNKADAYGLIRAETAGIATRVLNHRDFADRDSYDQALITCIDEFEPQLLVLAGFMRILTPTFTQHYLGRTLNIHPSLLPKYPGLHTHQRALEAGDSEHGASVHFVTAELDGGPVILQARVPVESGDTEDSLAARVLTQEHIIYAQVVQWFAEGRLRLNGDRAELDGAPLSTTGAS